MRAAEFEPTYLEIDEISTKKKKRSLAMIVGGVIVTTVLVLAVYRISVLVSKADLADDDALEGGSYNASEYAVWGFYPYSDIELLIGWNMREFNYTDAADDSDAITMAEGSNTQITLAPGTYWISGFSLVRWRQNISDGSIPYENPGGHAELYDDHQLSSAGTYGFAPWATPSFFSAMTTVSNEASVSVRHEVTPYIEDLWFGLDRTESHRHVYSRVTTLAMNNPLHHAVFSYEATENLLYDDSEHYVPFNQIDSSAGDGAPVLDSNGYFILQPGTYHAHGTGVSRFTDLSDPTRIADMLAGYCILQEIGDWETDEELMEANIASGCMVSPTYSTACVLETIFTLDVPTQIGFKYQLGASSPDVYIGMGSADAPEVYARLALFEVAEEDSYLVLSYFPTEDAPAEPGFNRRYFNTVTAERGPGITYDLDAGTITLTTGAYHLSGFSLMTAPNDDPEYPSTGYCDIRDEADEIITTCSLAVAAYRQSSLFDHVVEVSGSMTLYLQHQCGWDVDGVYMGQDATGTGAHLFARFTVKSLNAY